VKALKSITLVKLSLFAFLLQALFPIGYMPAPLQSGAPIQLCHSVFPVEFLNSLNAQNKNATATSTHNKHHAHQHAHSSNSTHPENPGPHPELRAQETCSFGALNLEHILFTETIEITSLDFSAIYRETIIELVFRRENSIYLARAPPLYSYHI